MNTTWTVNIVSPYWVITETFLDGSSSPNYYKIDTDKHLSYREGISFNAFFFHGKRRNWNGNRILYTAKTESEAVMINRSWINDEGYDPNTATIITNFYKFYEHIGYDRKKKKYIK